MPQTKRTAQRKRRSKVVLALGAASLSLSLASSASAAIGDMNGASSAPVSKQVYEEEIFDVSLATFQVFDREGRRARLAGLQLWSLWLCLWERFVRSPHATGARRPSHSATVSADPPGAQT
jgi:hypothetical protein